jgi:hypothetical protein
MDPSITIKTVLLVCEFCENVLGAARLPWMGRDDQLDEVLCDPCVRGLRRAHQPAFPRTRTRRAAA